MVVVKRQGREKPAKIEQRTSEDRSEDLRYNKQHSWLAWLAQFTYGRPRGRRKHIKRGAKGPGVCLSVCLSLFSLSLSLSRARSLFRAQARYHTPQLFASRLCISIPSHLKDVFSCDFLNKIEL